MSKLVNAKSFKDLWGRRQKRAAGATIKGLRTDRAALIAMLLTVELLIRVNARAWDGSPIHKAILKLLRQLGELE